MYRKEVLLWVTEKQDAQSVNVADTAEQPEPTGEALEFKKDPQGGPDQNRTERGMSRDGFMSGFWSYPSWDIILYTASPNGARRKILKLLTINIMNNEEHTSPKVKPKAESFITTAEKAQYEVFTNGELPKETIEKWIKQDLNAIQSFVHGILNDPDIFPAVVDMYYKKYKALHQVDIDTLRRKDHEPKRTTTGQP